MRIVYFGSGEFGVPTLKALAKSRHEIPLVVTQPARPAGRGRRLQPTAVATLANELHLKCLECENVNTPEFLAVLRSRQPQVLVVIAFGQKIGPEILALPDCRAVNLHSSLLPAYRGAAPINWAIINGESHTGVSVIELNDRWDAGAIVGRQTTDILPGERAGELHDRLALLGPDTVLSVLDAIEQGTDNPLPQDESLAGRAPKLRKNDALLDWRLAAPVLANRVHGTWPWPGAFSWLIRQDAAKSERITFARVEPNDLPCPDLAPGQLTPSLSIATGKGSLLPVEVKPQGGRLMTWDEFVRGRRLTPDDRFEATHAI